MSVRQLRAGPADGKTRHAEAPPICVDGASASVSEQPGRAPKSKQGGLAALTVVVVC